MGTRFGYSVAVLLPTAGVAREATVAQFDFRPMRVEAMQFEGTPGSAMELTEWAKAVAPHFVVRERIEYVGWDDENGHLELEVSDLDRQAIRGDWIVFLDAPVGHQAWIMTDGEFERYFLPRRVS